MEFPVVNINEDFMGIFYHLLKDECINIGSSRVNLFCLKVHNDEFDYLSLIEYLSESIISYCLSQKEYDEMYSKKQLNRMGKKAKGLFRDHTSNDGELGELILYSFLESHLEAPKILSKMRLKTSSNDYIKRADGIHLLKIDEENYEIIFGESKMYDDINRGLREAIQSINELKNRKYNNISDEIELINSHISSEFAEENYEFIKRIIKPSRDDNFDYDISFGMFVGFEIDFEKYKSYRGINLKKVVKSDLETMVRSKIKNINTAIKKFQLDNHNFYIYLLPFTEIDKRRKEIIEKLTI